MISGVSRGARLLALAIPLFVFGCNSDSESYPAELKYPTRTDIIVNSDKLRDEEVFYPDPPGEVENYLRSYKTKCDEDKKGEAYDPAAPDREASQRHRRLAEQTFRHPGEADRQDRSRRG